MLKVFLHIGVHKTGSSSIQQSLKNGAQLLRREGVLYPSCLSANHSAFFMSAFSSTPEHYHANKRRNLDREEIGKRASREKQLIEAEIKQNKFRALVFSAEDASVLQTEEILRFKAWIDGISEHPEYFIILYTRHPVSFVTSAIQENVKGNGLTISQAKSNHMVGSKNKYQSIVERYSEVFQNAPISALPFETEIKNTHGLVGRFLQQIGLPASLLPHERVNEGICDETIKIISYIREFHPNLAIDASDMKKLGEIRGEKGFLLSSEDISLIEDLSTADREFLNERFGINYNNTQTREHIDPKEDSYFSSLADLLPELSTPVRRAIIMYLKKA